jgi:hypothetical protein
MDRMGFVDDFTEGLRGLVGPGRRFKNANQMSEYLGQAATQTNRYLRGERTTYLTSIGDMLDRLGFRLLRPGSVAVSDAAGPPGGVNEEEFRNRVALDVARACLELSLDSKHMAHILAAAKGEASTVARAGDACAWPAVGRRSV